MRRRVRVAFGVVLLLVLLAPGAVLLRVLHGANGATLLGAALAGWLPELELEGVEGSLDVGRAARIGWRSGEVQVILRGVAWELAPQCPGWRQVCVDRFAVEALDILLPADDDGEAFPLEPVTLPFTLDLAAGSIGTLRIADTRQEYLRLDTLALEATLRGTRVEVRRLHAERDGLRGDLTGRVDLRDHLPIEAEGSIARAGESILATSVHGDLRRLELRAHGADAWPLDAEGWIEPLAAAVPLSIELRARAPLGPWPGATGDLQLAQASARIEGTLDAAEATLELELRSALLGENRVNARAGLSAARIALHEASLQGAAGRLDATGALELGGERAWQLEARGEGLHLPGIARQLDARLGGPATLRGTLRGDGPRLDLGLALEGSINALPARLGGRLLVDAAGALRIEALELASGPNRLHLDGTAAQTLQIDGTLDVPDLAATLHGAAGRAEGAVRLRGPRTDPRIEAHLGMRDPAWGGWHAAAIALDLEGNAAAHTLRARVDDDAVGLALDCSGAATPEGAWRGQCTRLQARASDPALDWRLAQPLQLARAANGALDVQPFCLAAGGARVCSTQRARLDASGWRGIAIRASALPAAVLARWLPADSAPQGLLDLRLDVRRAGSERPEIDAAVDSAALTLSLPAAGDALPLHFSAVTATLHGSAAGFTTTARARIGETGTISADLAARGYAPDSALGGAVELDGVDLGPLLRSLPGVLQAAGTLGGRIVVDGSLAAPELSGRLALADGALAHERLPEPIDAFTLATEFTGPSARIDGRFRTAAGESTLGGTAQWEGGDWSAALHFAAERLRIEPLRGSTLNLRPALDIALSPDRASVRGIVDVPTANIDLATVPQTAARVSDDAVYEGAVAPASRFDYALDLRLRLGEAVQFRGFGAEGRLAGELHIGRAPAQPLAARGEIRFLDGRYAAYGQRLEVTEGRLLFRGPPDRPGLRFDAIRRIEDEPVTVGVRVRGDARAPELAVFSRPAMAESRALHYLLTGRAPAEGETSGLAAAGALMSLGAAGATRVTGGVLGKLGIEDFAIDTRSVEGGTEVNLSGYLTPDLYLRYGVSTFDQVNTFRLRYRLRPHVFVEAISGIENAVDFLYSFER